MITNMKTLIYLMERAITKEDASSTSKGKFMMVIKSEIRIT